MRRSQLQNRRSILGESEFEVAVARYRNELSRYCTYRDEIRQRPAEYIEDKQEYKRLQRRSEDISTQIWKLDHETKVLGYLMETGVLPRYAFPGVFVDLEDPFAHEDFGGRSRN